MAAADDARAIEWEPRHLAGDDTCADEDLRTLEGLLGAVGCLYLDRSGLRHAGVALDVVDLVFLEEELDAAGEFVGDLAGTADHLIPVVLEAVDRESEILGMVRNGRVDLGILEQGLGRNAAPVKAGAAGALFFHHGNALAELGGADRADISGGSAADDDEVVGCRGHKETLFLEKRDEIGKEALVCCSCAVIVP